MNKKVDIRARWYGDVPTRNGKPLPKNQWARAGRRRKWTVRWYAPGGTRPRETFDSLAEAEQFARTKAAEFETRGPQARIRPADVTLGDYRDEFKRLRLGPRGQRLSIGTLKAYTPALDRFTAFVGDAVKLTDVSPADIARFVADLQASQVFAAATTNKYKRSLKAVFGVAVKQLRYLHVNPCSGLAESKTADVAIRFVTTEEYRKLIDACRQHKTAPLWWEAFITVCYTAATRKNEAVHLAWADVDFELGAVHIVAKPETGGLEAWQPKDHDARSIPVPAVTTDLLARLYAGADDGSEFVFISPARAAWIRSKREAGTWAEGAEVVWNVDRDFKCIAKRAGVPNVSVHDLRRSCITNWARRVPVAVVKELAGHSDVKTTLKYYVSVSEHDRTEAREAIAEALLVNQK